MFDMIFLSTPIVFALVSVFVSVVFTTKQLCTTKKLYTIIASDKKNTRTRKRTRKRARAHTHTTFTHTYAHTHTHTHTHTYYTHSRKLSALAYMMLDIITNEYVKSISTTQHCGITELNN